MTKEPSLAASLSKKTTYKTFRVWIVGDTPLITHAWSEKAKREMLQKQVKATKAGKEARDPQSDFVNSTYEMGEGRYGFPVTAIKKAMMARAHKDKGIARSMANGALWLQAEMTRVRPALAGAVCDMPLVQIWGSPPEMREDMVRVGVGLNKTASLAYRAQFTVWGVRFSGRYNDTDLNAEQIAFLLMDAGLACGLGEWRNEKSGVFGAFHLADADEEAAWDAFAKGKGKLPLPMNYQQAAE